MGAKENMAGCFRVTFGSNLARLIWATSLHILGIVLTVINLAVSTSSPKEALSWARFDLDRGDGNHRVNFGLLRWQSCGGFGGCRYQNLDVIENSETSFVAGGRGVITAVSFAMAFALISVIILWLWIVDKADKLRFPRIILQISNFLSLTLYIVAISTYYKLSFNQIKGIYTATGTARNIQPGYAIAIGIVVIVLSFFAWGFTFWRVCRPNKHEPAREKKEKKPKAQKNVDADVATSSSALDTAKAQQKVDADVEGQPGEPNNYDSPSNKGGAYGGGYGGGGSYGGNAYSNNDNAAYNNDNSSSAYGNGGGAYSQKESAYGY